MNQTRDPKVEEFYVSFYQDIDAFQKNLAQMLQDYPGEYVAILDGEIIDHLPDWNELVQRTRQRFPDRFVFLERVAPRENVTVDMDTLEG